ncbi:unnamed protein product [Vitrella brassicaformis CCMP3155]|uniref:Uncharacterized protein n=1 Tax=Vitrella brassicaformis (strain CCMP3155) TaxID=1169540 RepID=A0A0G4GBN0_VITBC|nr:unnamed protein product [Vitrella brassicaformis CCMP3155]|eukprot:CEM26499.1 unnamed protein product [Vitrella brassicaformis CCMP3155]
MPLQGVKKSQDRRESQTSTGEGVRKAKKVVNVGMPASETSQSDTNSPASASSSSAPSAAAALAQTEDKQHQVLTRRLECAEAEEAVEEHCRCCKTCFLILWGLIKLLQNVCRALFSIAKAKFEGGSDDLRRAVAKLYVWTREGAMRTIVIR